MKRNAIRIGIILGLMSLTTLAQMGPPAPSPELQKLDVFAGNWSIDATIPPGPWGNGGKFTSGGDAEWLKGGFFLVSPADFSMPPELGGNGSGLAVFGYDPDKKMYTEDRFDSLGHHAVMAGSLNGDTWTWTGENNYGGMTIKTRLTMKVTSPKSYTSKYDVSADNGTNWMTFWEGTATKK